MPTRKNFATKRKYGKRTARTFRSRGKYSRKGTRSVYKARRSKGLTLRRPSPSTIFKSVTPQKLVTYSTQSCKASAGLQGNQVFHSTPSVLDLSNIFTNAYGVNIADHARIAVQCKVTDECVYESNFPGTITRYRCKSRLGYVPTVALPTWQQYIASLFTNNGNGGGGAGDVTVYFGTGGAAPPVYSIIGWTPYDCTAFCEAFKILSVKKKYLKPGQRWKQSYTTRCKFINYDAIRTYTNNITAGYEGLVKGDICDVWFLQGGIAVVNTTSGNITAGTPTTAPGEVAMLRKWAYIYAGEPQSNNPDKYIWNEVPNPIYNNNAGSHTIDGLMSGITINQPAMQTPAPYL